MSTMFTYVSPRLLHCGEILVTPGYQVLEGVGNQMAPVPGCPFFRQLQRHMSKNTQSIYTLKKQQHKNNKTAQQQKNPTFDKDLTNRKGEL